MARYIEPITNIPKASAPLSIMPLQMQAAQQGAQTVMQGYEQNQAQERQLTERQMGIAFGNLLKTGVEGAQAYVEDLEDPEIKQAAQNRLNSLMPVLGNPQVQPEMAHKALLGFYQNIDEMNKSKNEPGYLEKKMLDKQLELDTFKKKEDYKNKNTKTGKSSKPTTLDIKRNTIPERQAELDELKSNKKTLADFSNEVADAQAALTEAEENFKIREDLLRKADSGALKDPKDRQNRKVISDAYAKAEKLKAEAQAAYDETLDAVKNNKDDLAYTDYLSYEKDYDKKLTSLTKQLRDIGATTGQSEDPVIQNPINPITTEPPKKIATIQKPDNKKLEKDLQLFETYLPTLKDPIKIAKAKKKIAEIKSALGR